MNFTNQEKLEAVEYLIEQRRGGVGRDELSAILGAIAKDIRARQERAPSIAQFEIESRITSAMRSKTALGYDLGAMRGIAEQVIGRWPVLKQALERFGAEIEGQ